MSKNYYGKFGLSALDYLMCCTDYTFFLDHLGSIIRNVTTCLIDTSIFDHIFGNAHLSIEHCTSRAFGPFFDSF